MCAERADCKKLQSWRSGAQFCIKPLHDDNMVKPLTAQSLCCVWKIFTSSEGLSLKQHTMILPIALSPAAIKSCSLIKPLLVILLIPMKRLGTSSEGAARLPLAMHVRFHSTGVKRNLQLQMLQLQCHCARWSGLQLVICTILPVRQSTLLP